MKCNGHGSEGTYKEKFKKSEVSLLMRIKINSVNNARDSFIRKVSKMVLDVKIKLIKLRKRTAV